MQNRYLMALVVLFLLSACAPSPNRIGSSGPESPGHTKIPESIGRAERTESIDEMKFTRLTAYNGTICGIKEDGTLVMWGSNVFAGIGNGEIDDGPGGLQVVRPYTHTFDEKIVDAGSVVSSYALTESGSLYTWGLNHSGECGTGAAPILRPQRVEGLGGIKQFSMSTAFSLALDGSGSVYHAGVMMEQFSDARDYEWNYYSEEAKRHEHFTKLPLDFNSVKIDSALCYVFLTDTAEVYMQGILLGDALEQSPDICCPEPVKLDFPERIVDIAALTTNIAALSESGRVYVFGRPETGLSDAETDIKISDLMYQKRLEGVAAIDGSDYCAMAVTADGDGYVWGLDIYGQILKSNEGKPRAEYEIIPQPVKLDYSNIRQFTMGILCGSVLDADGGVFIWGDSSAGQRIAFIK